MHAAARYALHGYFVQRHGWYVRGLSDVGDDSEETGAPNANLQGRVEEFVQSIFERRLGAHGLNLREMAILAATFENLVHREIAERLNGILCVLNLTEVRD